MKLVFITWSYIVGHRPRAAGFREQKQLAWIETHRPHLARIAQGWLASTISAVRPLAPDLDELGPMPIDPMQISAD